MIRVLCVDDHGLVRDGIGMIINRHVDMNVVDFATNAADAIALFQRHHPDVTLMDLRLGTTSGVEAIRAIRAIDDSARIIVLTMYFGDEDVFQALEAGAITYLLKDTIADELIRTIRDVYEGKRPPMSADVSAQIAERAALPKLTVREREIVKLISEGLEDKEIAALLGISVSTTHVHVRNLLAKLNVRHRTGAVRVALQRGIIHVF